MKKPIKTVDDIFYYVSKECNVSEDVVKNVYNNLWENIRYYLSKPFECGNQLMLNTFMKFIISEPKLYRKIKLIENGTSKMVQTRQDNIDHYKQLFELTAGESYEQRNIKIKEKENGKRQTNETGES